MNRLALLLCLIVPSLATAEEAPTPAPDVEPQPDVDVESRTWSDALAVVGGSSGSARSAASSWLILPKGWEASGELRFLTADRPPGGEAMKLTDVVISRASLRRSFKGKVEIAGGVDILPKQTSGTDELVFQGADLGARVGFKQKYAAYAGGGGGPLTDDLGWQVTGGAGVQRRSIVHQTLSFQLAVGGSTTQLLLDDPASSRAWLAEVTAGGQTLFRGDDMFGIWLGASFAFPVAHGGELMGAAFDPTTRVDLGVGAVYSVVEDWDVYIAVTVSDRGDLAAPETQLPILQGGSDQRVFTFGITRHFGQDDSGYGDDMYLAF